MTMQDRGEDGFESMRDGDGGEDPGHGGDPRGGSDRRGGGENGGGGDRHGGGDRGDETSDLVAALNALARGQEHLDARNGQILSRLDAVTLIQQQLTERVFDRIDALPLPPDSRDELIAVRDEVRRQGKAVDALQALPMHQSEMPAVLAKGLAAAVQGQVRPAVQAMEDVPAGVRRGVADIDRIVSRSRTRRQQNRWLGVVAGASLLAGFGLYPLLAANVPGGSHLAALAAGTRDRWQAGWVLMEADQVQGAAILGAMRDLYNRNRAALQACSQAVAAKRREQTCSVVMDEPLPAPPVREIVRP